VIEYLRYEYIALLFCIARAFVQSCGFNRYVGNRMIFREEVPVCAVDIDGQDSLVARGVPFSLSCADAYCYEK